MPPGESRGIMVRVPQNLEHNRISFDVPLAG